LRWFVQARFVIEYSYVRLMSATKKQADRAIRDQLCLLALLADTLEKVRRFNAPCVVLLCYLPGAVRTYGSGDSAMQRSVHLSARLMLPAK